MSFFRKVSNLALPGVRLPPRANKSLSNYVYASKYARMVKTNNTSRYETYEECIGRVVNMFRRKFPHIPEVQAKLTEITPLLLQRKILPSGRVMQFAGPAIDHSEMKGYNCSYLPAEDAKFFQEFYYILVSGTGVGISGRKVHLKKLPGVRFSKETERFVIPDSIEGWAEAVGKLAHAAFGLGPLPIFDYSEIRPKGAPLITSGGLAPGPEPLRTALIAAEKLFRVKDGDRLSALDILDITTTLSRAVESGGCRRSSMIFLFDPDDKEMVNAKTGEWWKTHPNRALCNNSAVFRPWQIKEVAQFIEDNPSIFVWGEPGIIFKNSDDSGTNPCAEAGLEDYTCCNLSDIIIAMLSRGEFFQAAEAAAFLGTLYASFTKFPFLSERWKNNMERDALIGVSLNGVAAVDYETYDLRGAAEVVNKTNEYWAEVIGINSAARRCLIKPGGTTGLLAGVPAGIHAGFANYAVRRVIEPANTPIADYMMRKFGQAVEPHLQNENNIVIKFPYSVPPGAKTRHEPVEEALHRITYVQKNWVLPGWARGTDSHSVSATVNFLPEDVPKLKRWVVDHADLLGGLSFIQHNPSEVYQQAPFTEVTKAEYDELVEITKNVNFDEVHGDIIENGFENQCSSGRCEIGTEKFASVTDGFIKSA